MECKDAHDANNFATVKEDEICCPPAVLVAPLVALAWEVEPLWVAKLVAHEVQP